MLFLTEEPYLIGFRMVVNEPRAPLLATGNVYLWSHQLANYALLRGPACPLGLAFLPPWYAILGRCHGWNSPARLAGLIEVKPRTTQKASTFSGALRYGIPSSPRSASNKLPERMCARSSSAHSGAVSAVKVTQQAGALSA